MAAAGSRTDGRERIREGLRRELALVGLLRSLNAGLVLYLFEVILVLSFAALVFSGELSGQLPFALGSILAGAAVLIAVLTLLSSYGGTMPSVQDAPSVILGLAAASIVASEAAANGEAVFATVVVLSAGTTLVLGVVCLALGALRLGALVRFLPYPVLGGFLAGTGWLLAMGGIRVAADIPPGAELLEPDTIGRWLPAALLGLVTFGAVRRWRGPLVIPALLGLAFGLFYLIAFAGGSSLEELSAAGWLLGPFPGDLAFAFPLDPGMLSQVRWPALVEAIPLAAPAVLFGIIGLLLNSTSIELVARRDLRLDRELIVTGGANVAGSALGGLPGFAAISLTILSHGLGAGRRLPGLLVAILLLVTAFLGVGALSVIPRLVLAGLLVYIGVGLLYQWVFAARSSFSRTDHLVVLSVLVVIAGYDLLLGTLLGLVLTVVLFVVNYSRVNLIRFEVTGAAYRSRVSRSPRHAGLLQAHGDELVIFKLQNYLFFGTAHQLVERVRQRVLESGAAGLRAVLLDFERVTGLDSTALLSFRKLVQSLRGRDIQLVLTGLSGRVADQVQAGGLAEGTDGVHVFGDMDRGVEFGEELILSGHRAEESIVLLEMELAAMLPGEPLLDALLARMPRREIAAGQHVVRQGEEADALYLIESGQLTARLERPGREPIRLVSMQAGRLVGEIGFFLGAPRSATVVADRPSIVRVLSREGWEAMSTREPELAQLLYRLAMGQLGRRVVELTRTLDALEK
jgi:sulfate permease, SulP family